MNQKYTKKLEDVREQLFELATEITEESISTIDCIKNMETLDHRLSEIIDNMDEYIPDDYSIFIVENYDSAGSAIDGYTGVN